MKHPWLLSSFFTLASVAVFFWMLSELGLSGFTGAAADEPAKVAEGPLRETPKKGLSEKEAILTEQLARYEKLVVELRGKLQAKEDELKMKLALKDDESKKKLSEKDSGAKAVIAQKDKEIEKLKQENESIRDHRTLAYKSIYEKMEAKKAAKILNDLDVTLAGQILGEIKESQAADIMSKMDAEKARAITERNFGRQLASVAPGAPKKVSQTVNDSPENGPLTAIQP